MPKRVSLRHKDGSRFKKYPVQKVQVELKRIRRMNGDILTPRAVWVNSRKKGDYFHSLFVWDNTEAANLYRDQQARDLVQHIEMIDEGGQSVRAWQHVIIDEHSGYMPTQEVIARQELVTQVYEEITRYLVAARKKMAEFRCFAADVKALDRIVKKIGEKKTAN